MKIDDFMRELEKLIFEHGDTCKVMTVIAKKNTEQKRESNLHPIMQESLKPFIRGLI